MFRNISVYLLSPFPVSVSLGNLHFMGHKAIRFKQNYSIIWQVTVVEENSRRIDKMEAKWPSRHKSHGLDFI
jgi:hypothetical protein